VYLGVNFDRSEAYRVAERSIDLTLQDWLQVDVPGALVIEADPQAITAEKLY
jgi:hypothetical protein